MRRSLWFTSAFTLILFGNFAHAQQTDLALGGSTLYSFKSNSASQAYVPPPERGGTYPDASAEVILPNHFGFSAEGAFRYHQGLYDGYQRFRPILYDINGVFTHRVAAKTRADVLAGFGGESLIFYNQFASCQAGVCPTSVNSNHFLLHTGVGVRYSFWRHFFIRPEAHYYIILNNHEFHSDNVFRIGASIGYTFNHK